MPDGLVSAFSWICGQHPGHVWAPGGLELACCQRCTGLYAGAAAALLLQWLLRPAGSPLYRWLHVLLILQMVPMGFHWVSQGPLLRTCSGVLFAFGAVGALCLLPGARLADMRSPVRRRVGLYWCGVLGTMAAVPALAAWGGRPAAVLLTALAVLGVLILAALALLNLGLLGRGAWAWLRRAENTVLP